MIFFLLQTPQSGIHFPKIRNFPQRFYAAKRNLTEIRESTQGFWYFEKAKNQRVEKKER
jgi:hypothetical protein